MSDHIPSTEGARWWTIILTAFAVSSVLLWLVDKVHFRDRIWLLLESLVRR